MPRGCLVLATTSLEDTLDNTILVKLKLWELDSIFNKHFGLPLTYAYATLRQSVADNMPFGELFFAI